jgi:anti-anti-sigma factor
MTTSDEGNKVTIAVAGKFDFQLYDEFRASYADTAGGGVEYVVDLAETEYLDSSALGMLLLLREHAGGESSSIAIKQATPEVRKILDVANFGKLFKL